MYEKMFKKKNPKNLMNHLKKKKKICVGINYEKKKKNIAYKIT